MTNLFDAPEDKPDLDPNLDPNKKYVDELVGEGRKFKTLEDLAKGKLAADHHVEFLKSRLDELRTDYLKLREESTAGKNLKELMDQMQQDRELASRDNTQSKEAENKAQFDPKQLDDLFDSKLTAYERQKTQIQNLQNVEDKLKERYGTGYRTYLNQTLETLGITKEFAEDLAKNHPAVFFKTVGLDQPAPRENFESPIRSDNRGGSFTPKGGTKRTWAYYQQMKRDNPKQYWDPKTSVLMDRDAIELGDAFMDGNWDH